MPTPLAPRRRAEPRRPSLRSAAIAAVTLVAMAVLLLGGRVSLAMWRVSGTASGGSFTTGALRLTPDAAGTNGCSGWTFASGAAYTGQPLEPGDALSATCDYTLTVRGDHLDGHVSVDAPTTAPPNDASFQTSVSVAGAARNTFTPADDGASVEVDLTFTVPAGDTSDPSADVTYLLQGVTVTATQDQP